MKSASLILVLSLTFSISVSQTPAEVLTGINPNTGYELERERKEMLERFKNVKKPEPYIVPEFKSSPVVEPITVTIETPKISDVIDEVKGVQTNTSIPEVSIPSPSPATNIELVQQTYTPYDKSMDKFIEGVYGYNPNMTLEENKRYYNEQGYTMSYKIKDSSIFLIGLVVLVIIGMGIFFLDRKSKYNDTFETVKTPSSDVV